MYRFFTLAISFAWIAALASPGMAFAPGQSVDVEASATASQTKADFASHAKQNRPRGQGARRNPRRDGFPRGVDRLTCDAGQTYSATVHGVADNFNPAGTAEPTSATDHSWDAIPWIQPWLQQSAVQNHYDVQVSGNTFADTFDLGLPANSTAKVMRITGRFRAADANARLRTDSVRFVQILPNGTTGFNGFSYVYNQLPLTSDGVMVWEVDTNAITPTPTPAQSNANATGQDVLDGISANGFIDIQAQDDMSIDYLAVEICYEPAEPERGLTFNLRSVEPNTNTVVVGCGPGSEVGDCNPYNGDTTCTVELPLLCFNDLDARRPQSVSEPNRNRRWSGGIVHTTAPIAASTLGTVADADAVCEREFGEGWRVATFHDGWGWNFSAYGNVPADSRFWVDINDQANGTCWAR